MSCSGINTSASLLLGGDAQHAALETKATSTTEQVEMRQKHHWFPCASGLNDVSFLDGIDAPSSNSILCVAFVSPCLKGDAVKCSSESPGLTPRAELCQPKHNNILTMVIQSWI